jgi:hypothetical protein
MANEIARFGSLKLIFLIITFDIFLTTIYIFVKKNIKLFLNISTKEWFLYKVKSLGIYCASLRAKPKLHLINP